MKILNKTLPVILAIGIFTTGPAAAYSISDVDVPFIDSSVTLKVDGEVATLHGNVDSPSDIANVERACLLYTSPSPRDRTRSRMPSSA